LKWNIGERKLQVIRLAFPAPAAERIEKALREEGRTVVYGIYFDFASDRIKEESEPVLKELAEMLTKNPMWRLTVEGHTDGIGSDEANLLLSQRRAAAVCKALGERYQIVPTRLEPSGFGETRPKATNETLEGRAQNRRVELARIGR
jgi:outer membrane protein OmpA-like peptidoglycan-associated protein